MGVPSWWFLFDEDREQEEEEEDGTPLWQLESNKCFTLVTVTVTKEASVSRKCLTKPLKEQPGYHTVEGAEWNIKEHRKAGYGFD